jgi:hypothetical protein
MTSSPCGVKGIFSIVLQIHLREPQRGVPQ